MAKRNKLFLLSQIVNREIADTLITDLSSTIVKTVSILLCVGVCVQWMEGNEPFNLNEFILVCIVFVCFEC